DEGPSAGPNRGSKRQKEGGEQASASTPSEKETKGVGGSTTGSQSRQMYASESAYAEEPMQTTCQMEETSHPPRRPPSPDRAWNTALPAAQGDAQPWISDLARQTDARSSFNELLDTPIDFSNFIMHRLNVDTLTPDLLAGPTYELMRGSCTSLTELEYHLEEVYKATTDQLDWVNPEGQQYPHNLLQPLPLIPDNRGRRVIPFEHFINNDLEYLRGGNKSIQQSDEQRKLYKALVDAYEADKAILDTYRDSTILKRRREDDDQEGPSAGPNRESKRQKEGEEPVQTTCQMEETPHLPWRPPSPDRAWNTALPAAQGDA
nr:hypothetical protein [Tanacetum cinerariifolium]